MTRLTILSPHHAILRLNPILAWLLGCAPERLLSRYVALGGREAWLYAANHRDVETWVAAMISSEQRKQAAGRRIAELRRGVYP